MTNKTLEGYPGARFHGGGRYVDVVERAAVDRAKELFDCAYANVQPHSGSQANLAVFFDLLKPGDTVLSLDLAAGGHLSHHGRRAPPRRVPLHAVPDPPERESRGNGNRNVLFRRRMCQLRYAQRPLSR